MKKIGHIEVEPKLIDDVEEKKREILTLLDCEVGDVFEFYTYNIDSWKAYFYILKVGFGLKFFSFRATKVINSIGKQKYIATRIK